MVFKLVVVATDKDKRGAIIGNLATVVQETQITILALLSDSLMGDNFSQRP